LFICAIGIGFWLAAPERSPARPVFHAYYVWQKQWNDGVRASLARADLHAASLMVLIGEVNATRGTLKLDSAFPDWQALAKCRAPVTLVLRANVALSDLLQSDSRDTAVNFVCGAFADSIAAGTDAGVSVRGLQLDYDCPSSKLGTYTQLVESIRAQFSSYELSITTLPTWLRWNEFGDLVRKLSYYVLQVHSLDAPETVEDEITLCDTSRIPGYLRRASAIGAPFYLALPTYGYRFTFDSTGKFVALAAEGPSGALQAGYRSRTVMADAEQIAKVVRALEQQPPHGLLGIAWFRMPVESDTLNWPWPALDAVRAGRAPETAVVASVRTPEPGLYEVWVENKGDTAPTDGIQISLRISLRDMTAYDTHNGFESKPGDGAILLTGPAPRPEGSTLAAWFRMRAIDSTAPTVGLIAIGL